MSLRAVCNGPIFLLLVLVMAGCELTMPKPDAFLDERVMLAKHLENQKRLADAMVQWKIVHRMYPGNEYVTQQMQKLKLRIDNRVHQLRSRLSNQQSDIVSDKDKNTYLKILSLQPQNLEARRALQKEEWNKVELAATKKTEKIHQLFEENQEKAQKEIGLARFKQEVKELLQSEKYVSLIKLTDKFLLDFPDYQPAYQIKYNALVGIANNHLKGGRKEDAINYYEQAQSVNDINSDSLDGKINELKEQVSNDFYLRGMKAFKSNIDKAVDLLKKSVEVNPSNFKAKQQLTRATKIQKNLQKIKQAS